MAKFYSKIYKDFSFEKFNELQKVFNIDIKRKVFSALKSERVQKKQKILTDVPSNKDFWRILIEKRKNHLMNKLYTSIYIVYCSVDEK